MSKTLIIIAIDPGNHGAIAWVDHTGARHVKNMPDTPMDILTLLREIEDEQVFGEVICYIEDVGQGMPDQSSSATAKFARHNGNLEAFLLADAIRTIKIKPQKWESTLGIGTSKGLKKPEWKRKLKAKAQERYPNRKVTLDTADALLILDYAIEKER